MGEEGKTTLPGRRPGLQGLGLGAEQPERRSEAVLLFKVCARVCVHACVHARVCPKELFDVQ